MNLAQVPIPPPNTRYCIPSNLLLDEKEAENFGKSSMLDAACKRSVGTRGLNYLGRLDEYFLKTKTIIDDFLHPIGCIAYQFSLFIAEPNVQSHRIHCDGLMWQGTPTMLDARLNFFHISPGHGILAWWDDDMQIHLEMAPTKIGENIVATSCGFISEWSRKWNGWNTIPNPSHAFITNSPSAFVRTSIPHTVLQGPKRRITISAMIVDKENDTINGVYDKIRDFIG
jgi:hypothetical protein